MNKMSKRAICFMLVFLMSVNVFAAGFEKIRSYEEGKFKDVPESAWYAESVKNAYETGLFNGASETEFNPNGEITIAETLTLAARMHSIYSVNGYEFNRSGAVWYQTYVDYAIKNGIIIEGEYADYTKKSNRLEFVSIIAASVPKSEFVKINEITAIHDLDESYDEAKREAVYMLYNAGVLTGSDDKGSFKPETSITRSEVAAILERITDASQRKEYKLATMNAETGGNELIFESESPEIDFSNDDGTMSKLNLEVRLMFEQSILPAAIRDFSEELGDLVVNDPESFLAFMDDEIWTICMETIAIRYMSESKEEFLIAEEADIAKHIKDISDRFSLHAYQHYQADAFKFDDNTYCILLNMADIGDALKVNELDKMFISPFIAIVYDAEDKEFSYFLLERSMDGLHMFCSYDKEGTHYNFGVMEKDKRVFVEGVKTQMAK